MRKKSIAKLVNLKPLPVSNRTSEDTDAGLVEGALVSSDMGENVRSGVGAAVGRKFVGAGVGVGVGVEVGVDVSLVGVEVGGSVSREIFTVSWV